MYHTIIEFIAFYQLRKMSVCTNILINVHSSISEMFYQHLFYLKSVHCYFSPPLVNGLYECENVDHCE